MSEWILVDDCSTDCSSEDTPSGLVMNSKFFLLILDSSVVQTSGVQLALMLFAVTFHPSSLLMWLISLIICFIWWTPSTSSSSLVFFYFHFIQVPSSVFVYFYIINILDCCYRLFWHINCCQRYYGFHINNNQPFKRFYLHVFAEWRLTE